MQHLIVVSCIILPGGLCMFAVTYWRHMKSMRLIVYMSCRDELLLFLLC